MRHNLTKIQKLGQDFFLLFDYVENEAWLITPKDFQILEEIFRGITRRYPDEETCNKIKQILDRNEKINYVGICNDESYQYSLHFGETTMGVLESMEDSPDTIDEEF